MKFSGKWNRNKCNFEESKNEDVSDEGCLKLGYPSDSASILFLPEIFNSNADCQILNTFQLIDVEH